MRYRKTRAVEPTDAGNLVLGVRYMVGVDDLLGFEDGIYALCRNNRASIKFKDKRRVLAVKHEHVISAPDIQVVPLLLAAFVPALVLPLLFTPSSHTVWTAIDLILRPLRIDEIDPRFVVVPPRA